MHWMRHRMVVASVLASASAHAQYTDGMIKIGVLTDMSSLYADQVGPGDVVATKLAVADFVAGNSGIKVEIIAADHQNKPDLGFSIASSWFDVEKVDVIVGGGSSGVALAASEVARQKNKVLLVSDGATSDLTGPKCNANTVHWVYDTCGILPTAPARPWSKVAVTLGSSSPPITRSVTRSNARRRKWLRPTEVK